MEALRKLSKLMASHGAWTARGRTSALYGHAGARQSFRLVDDASLGVGDAFLAGCFLFIGAIVMRLCVGVVGRGAPGDGRGSWS